MLIAIALTRNACPAARFWFRDRARATEVERSTTNARPHFCTRRPSAFPRPSRRSSDSGRPLAPSRLRKTPIGYARGRSCRRPSSSRGAGPVHSDLGAIGQNLRGTQKPVRHRKPCPANSSARPRVRSRGKGERRATDLGAVAGPVHGEPARRQSEDTERPARPDPLARRRLPHRLNRGSRSFRTVS